MMTEVIFSTVHGSHLYGLSNSDSDHDIYSVTTSAGHKGRQSVVGDVDRVTIGIDAFLMRVHDGSHQALEALFSPMKEWSPDYEEAMKPMLSSYRVGGAGVFSKYERTIKHFCFGDFKRRRHAVRLSYNLMDMRRQGWFNPVLTEAQKSVASAIAESLSGEELLAELMGERSK